MKKSVGSLCIYIPGTPSGPCLHSMKANAFNLATISQQLNTILIIRDDLSSIFWALMVGATGIEPVTPAVSRQCSTAELRTQCLINYSKLKINL